MRKVLIFCAVAVVAMLLPMIASSDLDKGREVRLVYATMPDGMILPRWSLA